MLGLEELEKDGVTHTHTPNQCLKSPPRELGIDRGLKLKSFIFFWVTGVVTLSYCPTRQATSLGHANEHILLP